MAARVTPARMAAFRVLLAMARSGNTLEVAPLEAIDGTPIVDIKPVLNDSADS